MGLKEDLQRKIDRKFTERQQLETQIGVIDGQIEVLREVVRMLPRDGTDEKKTVNSLRPNSDMAKARDFLLKVGKAVYVGDILTGIGKENTKPNRLSLSGSLGDYVRKGGIFTRPAPNTFGLVEFTEIADTPNLLQEQEDDGNGSEEDEMSQTTHSPPPPPAGFGKLKSVTLLAEDDEFDGNSPDEDVYPDDEFDDVILPTDQ